jgi:hypothetical protein
MLKFSGGHPLKYIFSGEHLLKYLYTILVPLLKLVKKAEIHLSLLENPLKSSYIRLKVELLYSDYKYRLVQSKHFYFNY